MNLAELWTELESSAPPDRAGRMMRRIDAESIVDLFAIIEVDPGNPHPLPALALRVNDDAVRNVDPPTGSRQIDLRIDVEAGERSSLVLALRDPAARELFAAMCTDVANATLQASGDADAVQRWIGRFAKWRRMLQGGSRPMSPERQRGLYAELLTMRRHLIPRVGFDEAIEAWKGPDGAPRDFETGGLGVEVKSSASNEPQIVTINGERQLDDSGLDALFLIHESLEVLRDAGETLPEAVAAIRALGDGHAQAGTLEDRLLQTGYSDVHAPAYRRTGYSVRRTSFFTVTAGFPRITEADLQDGVGSVHYRLAIDACRDFETQPETVLDHIEGTRR